MVVRAEAGEVRVVCVGDGQTTAANGDEQSSGARSRCSREPLCLARRRVVIGRGGLLLLSARREMQ